MEGKPNLVAAPAPPEPLKCCSLKRKRPPTIEIPDVLEQLNTAPLPTSRHSTTNGNPQPNDAVSFEGVGFGVSSVKGKKKLMEDTHKILPLLKGNPDKGFFGVYDGHGGRSAAEFVAENLHSNILEAVVGEGNLSREEAVKAAYLKTDQAFLQKGLASGACCVTALIEGREVVVSNVGDCRAVLCRRGLAEALTKDHRAECDDERKRIENKGGYVEIHRGAWRVHGVLSVSRSIGDAHLKDWVIAEPETTILPLTPEMEFLILASDGLWEKVGNQEAIDVVLLCVPKKKRVLAIDGQLDEIVKVPRISGVKDKEKPKRTPRLKKNAYSLINREEDFVCENRSPPLKSRRISLVKRVRINSESATNENIDPNKGPISEGLAAASKKLVNLAVSRGSLDDITVVIIDFSSFQSNSLIK